ncbi:CCD63 protein, partial [Rhynochetos jubatus]|nr:CCD63 protein [Rhynochetos jubatus]
KEIKTLAREHNEALLMLRQVASRQDEVLDGRKRTELQRLLETRHQYDSLIRDRKAQLSDLDKQILELEKKIVKQNQITGKAKQETSNKQLQKNTETLELRLNVATVRFNTILAKNKMLREEIESLRIQKATLDKLHFKLRKKLGQQRSRMNAAIEKSAQAYEQRMADLERIAAMNNKNNRDTAQFSAKQQERERVLSQESKLKDFILAKLTDRSQLEEEAQKKKALKAIQRAQQRQGETFKNWEAAYMCLLELAEDKNIDQLVDRFIKKETKDFSCFNYAIEMKSEVEEMRQKIKNVQDEITALETEQNNQKSSAVRVLQELEERLMATTEEANRYEEQCKESRKALGLLRCDLETLLKDINCDATPIMRQLGENGQITDLNLMKFIDLVDKKTTQLLLMESMLRYMLACDLYSAEAFTNPFLDGTELLQETDDDQPFLTALDSTPHAIDTLEVPLDHDQLRQLVLQHHEEERRRAPRLRRKKRDSFDF